MVSEDLAQVSRSLGWEEFVGGGIDLHHLRGNHVTYIRRYVDDTARMLRTCIEQARGAHSSRPAAKTASPAP